MTYLKLKTRPAASNLNSHQILTHILKLHYPNNPILKTQTPLISVILTQQIQSANTTNPGDGNIFTTWCCTFPKQDDRRAEE